MLITGTTLVTAKVSDSLTLNLIRGTVSKRKDHSAVVKKNVSVTNFIRCSDPLAFDTRYDQLTDSQAVVYEARFV